MSIEKAPTGLQAAAEEISKALHDFGVTTSSGIVQMRDIGNVDAVHVLIGKKM